MMKPSVLSNVAIFISESFKELLHFLKSISFSRAIRVCIAVTLPVLMGIHFGYFEIGLALSDGAGASSENDLLFEKHLPRFNFLEVRNLAPKDKETLRNLQEAHLVWEQLQWLFSISGKMFKRAASVKLD